MSANKRSAWKTHPTKAPRKRTPPTLSRRHQQSDHISSNSTNSSKLSRSSPGRTTSGPTSASRECRSRWSRAGLASRGQTRPQARTGTVKSRTIWSSMKLLRARRETKMRNAFSNHRLCLSRIRTKKCSHRVKRNKNGLNA